MAIKILLEKKDAPLPQKQDKTAVLIIGRFQPPQLGHAALVDTAKKAFREYKYDAVVICVVEGKETSKDRSINPLSGKSRVYYLQNSKYGNGVQYIVCKSAFDAFIKCRELGYEPMCVVGGHFIDGQKEENRAVDYKGLLDKYFTEPDGTPIAHKAVVLDRDSGASGVESISGTTVRAAVKADRFDDFKDMVAIDNEKIVKQMFDEIKASLEKKNG